MTVGATAAVPLRPSTCMVNPEPDTMSDVGATTAFGFTVTVIGTPSSRTTDPPAGTPAAGMFGFAACGIGFRFEYEIAAVEGEGVGLDDEDPDPAAVGLDDGVGVTTGTAVHCPNRVVATTGEREDPAA